MFKLSFFLFLLALPCWGAFDGGGAGSVVLRSQAAVGICRATVVRFSAEVREGVPRTRTLFEVNEVYKGVFSEYVEVCNDGGFLDGVAYVVGSEPELGRGVEYLLWIEEGADGGWEYLGRARGAVALRGAEDVAVWEGVLAGIDLGSGCDLQELAPSSGRLFIPFSSVLPAGFLVDSNGISSRWLDGDRGEAIPYLVDVSLIPAAFTTNEVLGIISNAFQAWTDASGVVFEFIGLDVFPMAAIFMNEADGVIRIHAGDPFGATSGLTLGRGGRQALVDLGGGGRVLSNEFYPTLSGGVVVEHTAGSMQTASTYEEVMTHEIGHVLSFTHVSDTEALMFATVHGDGRGAQLGASEIGLLPFIYPTNTPPYSYDRKMYVVTGTSPPNVSGINEVWVPAYDLQETNLTYILESASSGAGSFSLDFLTGFLSFDPSNIFSAPSLDPAGNSFYGRAVLRISDGVNLSASIDVRILSLLPDTRPSASNSDGLPDDWMTTYFGHTNPQAGDLSRAQDDADGDGMSNLDEFRSGYDPTNATSRLEVTAYDGEDFEWMSRPYDVYVVESSDAATGVFVRVGNPLVPTNMTGVATRKAVGLDRAIYRIRKLP